MSPSQKRFKNPSTERYINRYEAESMVRHERFKEYFCPDYYQMSSRHDNMSNTLRHGKPTSTVGA